MSFVTAGLLILSAIPAVLSPESGAAAGWNIFLGLLLIGVVASGHPKAPLLAAILCALMLVRLIVSVAIGSLADAALNLLLLGMLFAAWRSLRNQAVDF